MFAKSIGGPGQVLEAACRMTFVGQSGPLWSYCSGCLRSRCTGYESLNFLERQHAVFIGVHGLENSFVSRLKFL